MPESPTEDAPGSQAEPASEGGPIPVGAEDVRAATIMGVIFVGTILLAMVLAGALQGEVEPVFEDPQNPTNPLLYLGLVVVFTVAILVVAKLGLQRIIQYVILGAVFLTMAYVYQPILGLLVPALGFTGSLGISVGLAGVLTGLLYYYPEWYVVDAAGISVAAGATGWFGFSFGLVPALVLLVAFAVYDFIAVYRTKHMLDLADEVMDLRLPVMLVVPKVRGYSFLEGDTIQGDEAAPSEDAEGEPPAPQDDPEQAADELVADAEGPEGGEDPEGEEQGEPSAAARDALFMGLGDIVIPGVLVVSAWVFLDPADALVSTVLGMPANLFVAASTLVGATIGFFFLMRSVLKGTPHAGLPALNGGALIGFLAPLLWLYGVAPLIPQF